MRESHGHIMDREQILQELENKKRHSRLLSKKILLIFTSVLIVAVLALAVFALLNGGFFTKELAPQRGSFAFDSNTDENYDIFKDKTYVGILESEPFINLGNVQTGITESLLPENYNTEGRAVKLLTDFVLAIQKGDSDAYNACFSKAGLISEGKRKAGESNNPDSFKKYTDEQYMELGKQSDFTMQQIYSVYITFLSETSNPANDTKTYTYELEYKIRRNNGTFRTDIGSDVPRPQEITVFEDGKTGETKIISIIPFSATPNQVIVRGWRVALVAVLAALIIAADIVLTVIFMKKINRSAKSINENEEKVTNDNGEKNNEETLGN